MRTALPGRGVAGQITERGQSKPMQALDEEGRPVTVYLDSGRVVRKGPAGTSILDAPNARLASLESDVTAAEADIAALQSPARARVSTDADQLIGSGAQTALAWDVEDYDTAGIVTLGSSATDLTVPTNGVYLVVLNLQWADIGVDHYLLEAFICQNGSNVAWGGAYVNQTVYPCVSYLGRLSASDVITGEVKQNTGGSYNVLSGAWMALQRLCD